mgnify:CR=1 FL=1
MKVYGNDYLVDTEDGIVVTTCPSFEKPGQWYTYGRTEKRDKVRTTYSNSFEDAKNTHQQILTEIVNWTKARDTKWINLVREGVASGLLGVSRYGVVYVAEQATLAWNLEKSSLNNSNDPPTLAPIKEADEKWILSTSKVD